MLVSKLRTKLIMGTGAVCKMNVQKIGKHNELSKNLPQVNTTYSQGNSYNISLGVLHIIEVKHAKDVRDCTRIAPTSNVQPSIGNSCH